MTSPCLHRGETFFGRQWGIFYFAVITENGSGDAPADVNIDTGKFAVSIGIREARQTVADTALNKTFLFHGIQRCARMGLTRNSKQHTRSGQAGYHRLFHNASCVAKFIVI